MAATGQGQRQKSRRGSSRRRIASTRRTVLAVVLAVACAGLLTALGWNERPTRQFQRALAALQARDWERLQYREPTLARRSSFEPHHGLVAAALLLEEKQFKPALRTLRYALRHRDTRAIALVVAGQALYGQNRFRDAELNFKNALQLNPGLADAHRWLAIGYYDIGLMPEAAVQFQRVAELDPDDPRPHRILADIHMDLGAHAIAVENFQESLRRDPRQVDRQEILVELAQAQLWLKRLDDALQTLSQCDDTAEALAMRADCLYARGDSAEACRLAQRALKTEPDQRLALLVLGRLAFDVREYAQAVDLLSRAVKVAPNDYDLRYSLMTALRAAGRIQQAEEELSAAEKLRELRERFDDLVHQASAAPYDADIRYQLGVLADRLELTRAAGSWFKAAVALDPRHQLALKELKKHDLGSLQAAALPRGG